MHRGYARVSTREQTLDLQTDALERAGWETIFHEVASGTQTERKELERLLAHAREGDVVVIWKLDRLGRSLTHLVPAGTALGIAGRLTVVGGRAPAAPEQRDKASQP